MRKIKALGKSVQRWLQIQSRPAPIVHDRQLPMMQSIESWVLVSRESEKGSQDGEVISNNVKKQECIDRHPDHSSISALTRLPPEIWYLIIKYTAFMYTEYGSGDASKYSSGKVKMRLLQSLATLSKFHRRVVLEYWAHTLHFLRQSDIIELRLLMGSNNIDILRYVRRLVCEDGYQVYKAPKNSFNAFEFLDELVLICHSDINFGGATPHQQNLPGNEAVPFGDNGQAQLAVPGHHGNNDGNAHEQEHPPPRMSYRRLHVKLPNTLRALRVYDSHVPDIYFIQKVADECPLLQSLTLARCTIFTCAQCGFWKRLPRTESDAYFSNQGVTAYAAALGKELKRIKNLEEIKIGIYLTDHAAIDVHLSQHVGLDPSSEHDLAVWEQHCEQCVRQYQTATVQLEREATEILANEITTLRSVAWASFCSYRRTGWSIHQITRNTNAQFGKLGWQ